jgi:hypothetical protein
MPGIFGVVARDLAAHRENAARLEYAVKAVFPQSEWVETKTAIAGADSASGIAALARLADGSIVVVDGTSSTHDAWAAAPVGHRDEAVLRRRGAMMELQDDVVGNVVFVSEAGDCEVLTDWTGSFPLYVAHLPGVFMFSSLLRPMARALSADLDTPGILQFLRFGYALAGRTFFKNIRRVQPGERVSYSTRTDSMRSTDTSRLWCNERSPASSAATFDEIVARLRSVTQRVEKETSALMMSAGWDSRTLLGLSARAGQSNVAFGCGYVHGNPFSRELGLVRQLCATAGLDVVENPLDASMFHPDYLSSRFPTTEDVRFPHWHRAGQLLNERGLRTVTAGVYGEVLGGHYGPPFAQSARQRSEYILRSLGGLPSSVSAAGLLVKPQRWTRHYLAEDVARSEANSPQLFASDVEHDLARLRARGITDEASLLEAFITEHRGTQAIVAQPLSVRSTGIPQLSLPYCDRRLLALATALPIGDRIHNRLNRRILQREFPQLLKFPTGAILVPARAPILLQEVSRVVAHFREERRLKRYVNSGGRLSSPWDGWDDFEFLRQDRCLADLVEDLRSPLWNKSSMRKQLDEHVYAFGSKRRVFSAAMELLRVYTVDLMLRRHDFNRSDERIAIA